MKKLKCILVALLVSLASGTAFAKDFDWSQVWCNYGGGIEEGSWLLTIDAGLYYTDFINIAAYSSYGGTWFIPPVLVELQYAKKIWKLPFTFGGYAGLHAYGYKYPYSSYDSSSGTYISETKTVSNLGIFLGGEAEYHVMLPPESLDVYVVTRLGANIPIWFGGRPTYYVPDYFTFGEAIGASWYFNNLIGLNLEFGYPFSKFGVTLKF